MVELATCILFSRLWMKQDFSKTSGTRADLIDIPQSSGKKGAGTILLGALFVLLAVFVMKQSLGASDAFVTVKDGAFYVDGHPYRYLGVNYWYACYLGANIEQNGRERLIRELDELKELGIDNLRILGASEESVITSLTPAIQSSPGVYNEKLLVGLDFALDEMAKRGMKAVIFLNNTWRWTGGMSQYIQWVDGQPIIEQNEAWIPFITNITRFYEMEECQKIYRDYIRMILLRRNTVNGRVYRDDPTIMAWQLANEPRPGEENDFARNLPVFASWVDSTAKYIKSLDSGHLLTTGSEGLWGCNGSRENYIEIHAVPEIDYATVHVWPLNWSWFDPEKEAETFPDTMKRTREYLDEHVEIAEQLGKPLVIEEFGLPRDGHDYRPQGSTHYRDEYFAAILQMLFEEPILNGINVWSWGGLGGETAIPGETWTPGTSFTGDNPVEPNGRNSIYSTDKSTLELFCKTIRKIDNNPQQ